MRRRKRHSGTLEISEESWFVVVADQEGISTKIM
jgi:hypothetical protein